MSCLLQLFPDAKALVISSLSVYKRADLHRAHEAGSGASLVNVVATQSSVAEAFTL